MISGREKKKEVAIACSGHQNVKKHDSCPTVAELKILNDVIFQSFGIMH